ncbi:MAG: MFS transporter [Alphaproteobacteria bacterium]|nr:MFS transporter [Alphaproteobacteria bacterium]
MTLARGRPRAAYLPWVMFALATSLYTYAFLQRVAPNVVVDQLMRDFGVTAALLGNLSAFYFYSYAGLQIPLGIVLDRFGARAVLAGAAILCAAGSFLFAWADNLAIAALGQLLIGAGAGVPFVGALVIARAWLPADRFAFVTGLVMFSGMAGALLGQAPLAALVEVVPWRGVFEALAVFALAWAAMLWLLVRDRPAGPATAAAPRVRLLTGMGRVLLSRHTWLISLYGALIAGPILSFVSLWSVAYLMQGYGLTRSDAAFYSSMVMVGWGVGAPLAGYVADRLRRRKGPMLAGAFLALAMWLALALLPDLPLGALMVVFFLLGLSNGGMGVMFAFLREHNPPALGSTATGVFNTICMFSPAAFQPLVGYLLDLGWDGTMAAGAPLYAGSAFRAAFLVYPLAVATAIALALPLRETRGQQVVRE